MSAASVKYTAEFKHNVLKDYKTGVRGHGWKALAKTWNVEGGVHRIKEWYKRWNGSVQSLQDRRRPNRDLVLTEAEERTHILHFVRDCNRKGKHVDYKDVHANVTAKTGKEVSYRTVKRIGKERLNLRYKVTTKYLKTEGTIIFLACLRYNK